MKKYLAALGLAFVLAGLGALEVDLNVGPAYGFYALRAKEGIVTADVTAHSLGLDLNGVFRLHENWEIRLESFLGGPFHMGISQNGEGSTSPDLANYTLYKHHLTFSAGGAYRVFRQPFSLSAGPYFILNNMALVPDQYADGYLISYTFGAGLGLYGDWALSDWLGLYAQLGGNYNWAEILVIHEDFVSSWGGFVSLGVRGRF